MYDLNVDAPEKFPAVLENVAEHYRQSHAELSAGWQETSAGRIWADFAAILDRAAKSARKALERSGYRS